MKPFHQELARYPIILTIPVLWGDQDAFGHVNNLVYLRWCETARVEYLRRAAMWPKLPPDGVGPILASIKCDYRRPLNHPDTIQVGARVARIGNSSFRMEHLIVSKELGIPVAIADSTLVLLDYSLGKTVPVPAKARKAIGDLEGREFDSGVK